MKKRKPLLIAGIVITAVVIVVFWGAVILGNYIEGKLQNRQLGAYQVQTEKADVNVFLRRITIRDAVIEDSAAKNRINAPVIEATGIHILPFVFNDKLIVNKLLIQQPEIFVMQDNSDEEAGQQKTTTSEPDREIEQIRIKQLEVKEAAVLLQKQTAGETDTLFALQAGFQIQNLNIFSDSQPLSFKNHSAEKLELQFTNGIYNLPGGLYQMQFDSVKFKTDQENLELKGIHFLSLHSKYNIAKHTGVETDWYDMTLEQINVNGINIQSLLQDTAVIFRSAVLEGLNASIFRDKRPPFPDKPDSKLPVKMLKSLPFPLYTDSILIKNGAVVYEEHGEESKDPGKVTFSRLYATLYNLGTLEDSIDGQTAMTARAMVMNEALLNVEFIFPNNEYSHQYKVSGSLEPIRISAFNPMLIPAAFVKVEEGRINHLDFDFSYDNNKSEGSLALTYENLDISLLDKEDGSQKTIKTFLTETFVLQEDNLQDNNSYQEGTISFERHKKKSIFNYWWKSLFSGIKDILAF